MHPGIRWEKLAVFVVMVSLGVHTLYAGVMLSEHITTYQPLFYDAQQLQQQHLRSERVNPSVISLDFEAFGRRFNLTLQPDRRLFSPYVTLETTREKMNYDLGWVYTGHQRNKDDKTAPSVRGVISSKGHFEGTISSPPHLFIVEKAAKHFKNPTDFHSVIYKASDTKFDIQKAFCGSTLHRKNLIQLQKILKKEQRTDNKTRVYLQSNEKAYWSKHKSDADWRERYLEPTARSRRSVPTRSTCELYLQADHLYLAHLGGDVEAVIQQLANTVLTLNSIYSTIDFDGNGVSDNINFVIRRLKVHTDPEEISYRLNGHFGVEKFLELHSTANYSQYCLSYMFTHRDFDGGTLGLAWTAGDEQAGGLCDTYMTYRQGSLTLNTGVVTSLNYGKTVPSHVTALTLAHEIGHNFGAQHDAEGSACTPGGTVGNYIMYARATDGYLPNNDHFSSCSVAAMAPFILARGVGPEGCFVERVTARCGNRVVEEGEACDCGYEADCKESCCNPQTNTPGANTPCTVRDTSVCSPSSGPCCDTSCQYITNASTTPCRDNTSCLEPAYCASSQCPVSVWKPDRTSCEDQRVCINGTCSGSACLQKELEPCQCSPSISGDWQDVKLCSICCLVDGKCKPSYEITGLPNGSNPAGSPCNDFMGYCDVFYRCREVDPSGTFRTLKKLLSPESLESIKMWMTEHWYVLVLSAIGFIILMMDFEVAARNAVKVVFPGVEWKGCFFHFTQCVWRKTQQVGLQIDYIENPDVNHFVRLCAVLPLVPVADVLFIKVCGKHVPSDKELYERKKRNPDLPLSHRSRRTSVAPTGYM